MTDADTAPTRPRLSRGGLRLGDEELPLFSGAIHYYHLLSTRWDRCLEAAGELGLPLVESYVPWAVHERAPGRFDFDGHGGPADRFERDLGGFLTACAARGLKVILRPGPQINGELTYFGLPHRLLADERCLARGAQGNPVVLPVPPRAFPVPSYASERFLSEAERWLQAVAAFLAPYAWPRGPLVALQVDNELSLFFRTAAYDQDYHPDAIAAYRRFLTSRYPDGLPGGYGSVDPAQVTPPRALERPPGAGADPAFLCWHLDWLAFKEQLQLDALERFAGALRQGGCAGLPLLHNLPAAGLGTPFSPAAAEARLDLCGVDLYARAADYAQVKQTGRLLSGVSRLPYVPELGSGGWPWWFSLTPEDEEARLLAALMHGVKGFNLYMLVDRDRWYGAPVSADGSRQPRRFAKWRELLTAVREAELPALEQQARVALLQVRAYEQLGLCSSLLDPLPPLGLSLLGLTLTDLASDEHLGLAEAPGPQSARLQAQLQAALERARLPFCLVDSDTPLEALRRFTLLVVPTLEFLPAGLLQRLQDYVAGGGRLLLGPTLPTLDETLQKLAGELPAHGRLPADGLATLLESEAARLGLTPGPRASSSAVELCLHYKDGRPHVLFAANREAQAQLAAVSELPAGIERVWDALTGEPVDLGRLRLAPHQLRLLRLEGAPGAPGEEKP